MNSTHRHYQRNNKYIQSGKLAAVVDHRVLSPVRGLEAT